MRILFDMGVYDLRNKGNVAQLQVAVERIHALLPNATLEVITSAPYLLRLYLPYTVPVSPTGDYNWSEPSGPINVLFRWMPVPILRIMFELRERLVRRLPGVLNYLSPNQMKSWLRRGATQPEQVLDLREKGSETHHQNRNSHTGMIPGIDLFVATGGNYMADVVKEDALDVLDRIETAIRLKIPTVMVGQGLGPIEDAELYIRALAVIPKIDHIFIREKIAAPKILHSFGVDPARIRVTGDDAVELAYAARNSINGDDIGVGLRVAHYTEMNSYHLDQIRSVLHQAAQNYQAQLISLPISESAHELDRSVIEYVLSGSKYRNNNHRRFDTPFEIVKQTGRCRIVIAGTYHTAVFAMAQGIPAVGLVKSIHYVDKFNGLADIFGAGCEIVYLDDEQLERSMRSAIDRAWNLAEKIKPQLLAAAESQIELGRAAYQGILSSLS